MNEEQVEGEARNRVGGSEREQKVQYKHEERVSKNMRGAKEKKNTCLEQLNQMSLCMCKDVNKHSRYWRLLNYMNLFVPGVDSYIFFYYITIIILLYYNRHINFSSRRNHLFMLFFFAFHMQGQIWPFTY